jgi:DNA polymerase phi
MATTTLQLYWDLASFEPSVRQNAAQSLIKTLADFQKNHEETLENASDIADTEEKLDLLCASDVSYAVRRLLRGLPSSRQGARQGFSLALTEVRITVLLYIYIYVIFSFIFISFSPLLTLFPPSLFSTSYFNILNVLDL